MQRLILVLPLLLIAGCSSGTSSGIGALLSGSWAGTMISTNDPSMAVSGNVRMNLDQDEFGVLSGIITISDPETMCWIGGTIDEDTSSITGSRVIINFADSGGSAVVFDANATSNTINGLYNSGAGACAASSGTVQLNRV